MAEGQSTLPPGLPKLTLGWGVIENATQWIIQPDGPRGGQPWVPTDSQARFTLSFLGLMLVWVVETTDQDSWPNLHRELERMCLGEFSSATGRALHRSETSPWQRQILSRLEIAEPKLILEVTPAPSRLARSA